MKINEFQKALKEDDFSVGDSIWIGNWEFEVVSGRIGNPLFRGDEIVFKWDLTRNEFIQALRDNHPEIKNPQQFSDEHEDEIIHYFKNCFDILIGECGATYETIMDDAIDEVLKLSKSDLSSEEKQKSPNEQDFEEDKNSKSAGGDGSCLQSQQDYKQAVLNNCNLPTQVDNDVKNPRGFSAMKSFDRYANTPNNYVIISKH